MSRYFGSTKPHPHHSCIVRRLKVLGCVVQNLTMVGEGCPELVAIYKGRTYWLRLAHNVLDNKWDEFAAAQGVPVFRVDSAETAAQAMGLLKTAA